MFLYALALAIVVFAIATTLVVFYVTTFYESNFIIPDKESLIDKKSILTFNNIEKE